MTANVKPDANTYRTTARVVGALFVAGMLIGIPAFMFTQSILNVPDRLSIVPASSMLLAFAAIMMLLTVVGDALHGVLMFPIIKQDSERTAVGYLAFRIVDAAFIAISVVFLLLQIPLGREYVNAAVPGTLNLQALSNLAIQANLYAYDIAMTFLGVAGLMLCYTFYRTRLVPRPLAVWGLVGYAVILGGSVLQIMGFNLSSMHTIPGGLWEIFIGVWLIAKGFNASAFVAPARRTNTVLEPLLP
jgi:uncharacterized membrane protein